MEEELLRGESTLSRTGTMGQWSEEAQIARKEEVKSVDLRKYAFSTQASHFPKQKKKAL